MTLQLARKHDHSDAEGVLLRAGARDPQAEAWPGGATRAPVSSALDAGGSSDAPQQESGSGSPAPDSHPHRGGDTESEHSVSQTGVHLIMQCRRDGVHLTRSDPIKAEDSDMGLARRCRC